MGIPDLGYARQTAAGAPRRHPPMTPNPRQNELMEVRTRGSVTVEALADQFGVTLQTVRRDVQRLAESRAAGALPRRRAAAELHHREHRLPPAPALNADGKARIAKRRGRAVPEGCSLIINIGTTTEAIARELLHHKGLRVITNNLNVATILSDNADCEVIVAGGVVRSRDRGIIGEAAVDFIRQFKVDIGLIGISGIEADGTLRDFDYREVKVARAIIEHSREVWLAADHSKFNRPGDGRSWRTLRRSTCCSPTRRRPTPFPRCCATMPASSWWWRAETTRTRRSARETP
jgi:DeoR family glycerol-3-phosphate regulon repressor